MNVKYVWSKRATTEAFLPENLKKNRKSPMSAGSRDHYNFTANTLLGFVLNSQSKNSKIQYGIFNLLKGCNQMNNEKIRSSPPVKLCQKM